MHAWSGCLLIAFALGCGTAQVGNPTGVEKAREGGSTSAAFGRLSRRPAWLFPFNQCPADVFPGVEQPAADLGEVCANALDACVDRCEANDASACYWGALRVQELKAPPDYAEALFLKACRLGVASGCTNRAAGMVAHTPTGGADPWPCASRTFEAMCRQDDPWGCTMWGFSLFHGHGVPRDVARARKVLPKGCLLGEQDPACETARKLLVEANATAI